ncbi:MAG TPA: hypothetical protein PLU72_16595 [Candidatus Ozemobacteraceae bacterium]|nr:hypothetical protein [Candidatus Ozemobacteraceae bacterium]
MTFKLEIPLDRPTAEAMATVVSTAQRRGVKCLLIGAAARDLILVNGWNRRTGTATRDLDFAFALESWEQFHALKMALKATGSVVCDERSPHLVQFSGPGGIQLPIDLIPFGPLETPAGEIRWPGPDGGVLPVHGFQEAMANALEIEIRPGLMLRVASIPSQVVLKCFAWRDRKARLTHDASDIALLLRTYAELGNEDRLYGDEYSILQQCGFDPVLAGARLLGQDIRRMHGPETCRLIRAILDDKASREELSRRMVASLVYAEEEQVRIARLLSQFHAGITA